MTATSNGTHDIPDGFRLPSPQNPHSNIIRFPSPHQPKPCPRCGEVGHGQLLGPKTDFGCLQCGYDATRKEDMVRVRYTSSREPNAPRAKTPKPKTPKAMVKHYDRHGNFLGETKTGRLPIKIRRQLRRQAAAANTKPASKRTPTAEGQLSNSSSQIRRRARRLEAKGYSKDEALRLAREQAGLN